MATDEATLPGITCDGCIGTLRMVARIEKDALLLDPRTVPSRQDSTVIQAVTAALSD